ncbi:hypothetical protein F4809DRAFT_596717 [Biscogniauxia mediterranea]|nr:hypothetical protein F4809DRAFT_596717 [Biscogniauxia mediterranea]
MKVKVPVNIDVRRSCINQSISSTTYGTAPFQQLDSFCDVKGFIYYLGSWHLLLGIAVHNTEAVLTYARLALGILYFANGVYHEGCRPTRNRHDRWKRG